MKDSVNLPYQETINVIYEEFCTHYGFPPLPVKEEPQTPVWWKDEETVLPRKKTDAKSRHPHIKFIGIDGPPQFGKSTVLKRLNCMEDFDSFSITNIDEPYLSTIEHIAIIDNAIVYSPDITDVDDPPIFVRKNDPNSWIDQLQIQQLKLNFWTFAMNRVLTSHSPTAIISARGPLDILLWQYALHTHSGDPRFTIPEIYEQMFTNQSKQIIAHAGLQLINHYQAVVIGGLSQKEAQHRRENEGKKYSGWVTDSPFYNTMLNWQGYFAHEVLPKISEFTGMGYMIVDGEKPEDDLQEQIVEFVKKVIKE